MRHDVRLADGHTLTVLDAEKVQHKVLLHGADAPGKGRLFGAKAKEALAALVFKKAVTVEAKDADRYGRIVGKVTQGEIDVNLRTAKDSYAWQYWRYERSRALIGAQEEAKAAKPELWADAEPVRPWEFKKK